MSRHTPVRAAQPLSTRRLLRSLLDLTGPDVLAHCRETTPWASALYDGTRHLIELELTGEDAALRAEALAQLLPNAEFLIMGNIVADLAVDEHVVLDAQRHRLDLSVLTIADA
ncbi:MAG: hypothetical protein QHC67_13060 [Sphingobium sp.]|uniref:hypothetical protein n=1 Tax=Sphingobium sp. TaxID=1912891 RepID=UPI0029A8D76B|nr:hypothetical protein [Sphingobium sp.]MDX3910729.1 hypothetical protein [Sphingobium sp.]